MRTLSMHARRAGYALVITACSTTALAAQLPSASPAAMALGGAYTARATGYDAVAWNPANLALAANPGFSFTIGAMTGSSGLDPISLSNFAPYSNKDLPASVRTQWLQDVQASNGENGRVDGGITELGLSVGPFALQVGSSVGMTSTLAPDMFEALMFGNAGRTGTVENLQFAGSRVKVAAFTTGGLSYGRSVANAFGGRISVGATAKYVVGNFLAMGQDNGSVASANSVDVKFPVVYTNPDSSAVVGNGVGLDLGGAWHSNKLTLGATLQNVMNTFKWDQTKFVSKPGNAFFNGTSNTTDFNDQSYTLAPQTLRDRVAADKFKPAIAVGGALELNSFTTVSADARQQLTGGISTTPDTQLGAGVEFRWIPLLTLRGGAQYITSGFGVGGGVGLHLGPYELGVAASLLERNGGRQPGISLNVLSIR